MKKIKFRLLNENNEIVGYEKWYVGSFNIETKKDYYVSDPRWLYSKDGNEWTPGFIDHRYKEQFTGLTDKNGKEYCDGDIASTENDFLLIVTWSHATARWEFISIHNHEHIEWLSTFSDEREIIGNIHENQELLENK